MALKFLSRSIEKGGNLGIDPNPPWVPKGFQFLKYPLEVKTCPHKRGPVHANMGPSPQGWMNPFVGTEPRPQGHGT